MNEQNDIYISKLRWGKKKRNQFLALDVDSVALCHTLVYGWETLQLGLRWAGWGDVQIAYYGGYKKIAHFLSMVACHRDNIQFDNFKVQHSGVRWYRWLFPEGWLYHF